MSNATPFALGLGGGLALWQLLRPTAMSKPFPPVASDVASGDARRNGHAAACLVRIDAIGVVADGAHVEIAEAVRRARLADRTRLAVDPGAPAATCAELLGALRAAGVAMRTVVGSARNGAPPSAREFSLVTYPRGIEGKPTIRYFRAEAPIAWTEARDRLAAAGLLELGLAGRTREPGGWMLSIDRNDFRAKRPEPFPQNPVSSMTFTLAVYPDGIGGPKKVRWFAADEPTRWNVARDRLAEAGVLDPHANRQNARGYWILVTSPEVFDRAKAEPLPRSSTRGAASTRPAGCRRSRNAARSPRYTRQGPTIFRDCEPIVSLERVDEGNNLHAISAQETDQLAERFVRALNRKGAR
jgi:hypothetical protein